MKYSVEEIEKMLEAFFSEPENIDGTPNLSEDSLLGNAGTIIRQLLAERSQIRKQAVLIYNLGYGRGHHDTVEGQYVDIHRNDQATYHAEVVEELLSELALRRKAEEGK